MYSLPLKPPVTEVVRKHIIPILHRPINNHIGPTLKTATSTRDPTLHGVVDLVLVARILQRGEVAIVCYVVARLGVDVSAHDYGCAASGAACAVGA